jgi:6-phosphogluconate dehydrogenase
MVHNGIEYVEMQLLAEIYQLLRQTKSNNEISEILNEWNKEEEKSFLLDISAKIFTKKVNNEFLLDLILDKAGNKGTGSWSTIAALMMGSDNSIMSSAVFARYLSSFKRVRSFLGGQDSNNEKQTPIDVHVLQQAYNCARKLNHIQGFELIRAASVEKSWNINCSELARVWTNGCIIRSTLMEELSIYFTECDSLLTNNEFLEKVRKDEQYISMVIHNAVANRIAIPVFSSTWNYWIGLTTANGPTNLIQAQRDFFGAHTYQRIDDPRGESYHTNWEE